MAAILTNGVLVMSQHFQNSKKNHGPMSDRGGPRLRTRVFMPLPVPLCAKCLISIDFTPRHVAQRVERVGLAPRRAPPRPTVERIVDCSPVVFNDIKHLTATCDR